MTDKSVTTPVAIEITRFIEGIPQITKFIQL
ncbi:LrgB family protein [Salegentibacter sp.]